MRLFRAARTLVAGAVLGLAVPAVCGAAGPLMGAAAAPVAEAPAAPAAGAPPAKPAVEPPIPIPDIFSRAEALSVRLRGLTESASDDEISDYVKEDPRY